MKLDLSAECLLPTLDQATKSFNFISKIGFESKITNRIELHHLVYNECRQRFSLPSQLIIASISKAAEALRSIKSKNKWSKCPQSKAVSIRYDQRSYSISKSGQLSISTIEGRKKVELKVPPFYKDYFENWRRGSADLVIRRGKVYLHVSFERDMPEEESPKGKTLGIDRGINRLAVCSDGKFHSSRKLKEVAMRYKRLRTALQKRGTRSAKRHLCRVSGKEKRFKADINHQISKQIVDSLEPGDIIAVEDLSGIRNIKLRKKQREALHSWNYYQLGQFLTYKAVTKGVKVVQVDPAYTSQMCSRCGTIDRRNRKTQSDFCCLNCDFKLNADLNASRNIAIRAIAGV